MYDIMRINTKASLLENVEHLSSYQKCTSDNARKKVSGSCYIEKIANFQKIHCKRGEPFTDRVFSRDTENTWMVLFVITVQVITGLGLNF